MSIKEILYQWLIFHSCHRFPFKDLTISHVRRGLPGTHLGVIVHRRKEGEEAARKGGLSADFFGAMRQ